MWLKILSMFLFISGTSLLSICLAQDIYESPKVKSAIDVIQYQVLPQRLEIVLKRLLPKCRKDIETPMRNCLVDYNSYTNHARYFENEYSESKRVGCCHVWKYDNCIISLVRSRARNSFDSCTEEDLYETEKILDPERIDPKFNHYCEGYHKNSYLCNNEPVETWLLILLWVVGGTAIIIALSGSVCMLFWFVTSGSRTRPRIFILNPEGTKRLIDNMDA